jgi:hypothetical protein
MASAYCLAKAVSKKKRTAATPLPEPDLHFVWGMMRAKQDKPQTGAEARSVAYSFPERTFNTELRYQPVEMHSDGREFLDPVSFTIVVPVQACFVIPCEQ